MPLLILPPSDNITRAACGVLGKALFIAAGFEDDCRSLAFVLKVREPQSEGVSEEEFFATVSRAVLGKLVDLNNLIARRGKLNNDYSSMLHAARSARNYIAHEAAGEFERLLKAPHGFRKWRDVLASKLEEIAYGRIIVAVLLSRNSAENTPTQEAIENYSKGVLSWVFSEAADADVVQ